MLNKKLKTIRGKKLKNLREVYYHRKNIKYRDICTC